MQPKHCCTATGHATHVTGTLALTGYYAVKTDATQPQAKVVTNTKEPRKVAHRLSLNGGQLSDEKRGVTEIESGETSRGI